MVELFWSGGNLELRQHNQEMNFANSCLGTRWNLHQERRSIVVCQDPIVNRTSRRSIFFEQYVRQTGVVATNTVVVQIFGRGGGQK
ncbi:hypothetical protein GCK32_006429 [Trichostrongylus colubriformis]|uniref:Uncharacterized protein n=1 Tax=Trichostrongylus colubriformis TaxID=6319 RepID=A0AAN8F2Y6_TRICO